MRTAGRWTVVAAGLSAAWLGGVMLSGCAPAGAAEPATETSQVARDAPLLPDEPSVGTPYHEWFGPTQCDINERVAWSCKSGTKVISVCASDPISGDEGWMQYRIGKMPKTEFVFPKTKAHPRGLFGYRLTAQGDVSLSFSNGDYNYEVFDVLRSEEDGVIVSKGGKEISRIICNGGGSGFEIQRPDLLGIADTPYGN